MAISTVTLRSSPKAAPRAWPRIELRCVPGPAYRQREERGDDHCCGESGEQGRDSAEHRLPGSLVDADRADQAGDGEEDVEAGRVDGVRADLGLVELHGIAAQPLGGAGEHNQVRYAGLVGERLDEAAGLPGQADQAHVKDHRRSAGCAAGTGPRDTMVSPACGSGAPA